MARSILWHALEGSSQYSGSDTMLGCTFGPRTKVAQETLAGRRVQHGNEGKILPSRQLAVEVLDAAFFKWRHKGLAQLLLRDGTPDVKDDDVHGEVVQLVIA